MNYLQCCHLDMNISTDIKHMSGKNTNTANMSILYMLMKADRKIMRSYAQKIMMHKLDFLMYI